MNLYEILKPHLPIKIDYTKDYCVEDKFYGRGYNQCRADYNKVLKGLRIDEERIIHIIQYPLMETRQPFLKDEDAELLAKALAENMGMLMEEEEKKRKKTVIKWNGKKWVKACI